MGNNIKHYIEVRTTGARFCDSPDRRACVVVVWRATQLTTQHWLVEQVGPAIRGSSSSEQIRQLLEAQDREKSHDQERSFRRQSHKLSQGDFLQPFHE